VKRSTAPWCGQAFFLRCASSFRIERIALTRDFDLHFGIVSPPVPGHIHPFGALGRELIRRGHRVSLIHMPDLEEQARQEGLEFISIGHQTHPRGSLGASLASLGKLHGVAASKFTIRAVAKTTRMMLEEGPRAVRAAGISILLVDQMEPAGGTIADYLGLPFVTVCNALALNREPGIPPPFTPWRFVDSWWGRARNRLGYLAGDRFTRPVTKVVDRYRRQWGLHPHAGPEDSFSPLAQISQQPSAFDYPRRRLPPQFHYAGPLRSTLPAPIDFPWGKLDGRPLIYASLGTLQNSRLPLFRCFAEACRTLDAQLVMTHGGGLSASDAASISPGPLIVSYAPQLELIARARLTLTHAGLNTVLDSLSYGVPVVAIPITYEQPAIAERLRYAGAGESLAMKGLGSEGLRETIKRVMSAESYTRSARRIAESIREAGGVQKAADIILAGCGG
jgi:zeaxanthin glucosyltransferase